MFQTSARAAAAIVVAFLVGVLPDAPDIVRADDPPIRDDCFVGKGPGGGAGWEPLFAG